MLSIIICGAVAVLFLIIGAILSRSYMYDFFAGLFVVLGIIAATVFAIMLMSLINIKRDFQTTLNEYEITKVLVENYTPNDYGNQSDLLQQVISINKRIARHKAYADNKWTGVWYSEEIGALEPLSFKCSSEKPPIKE